MVKKKNYSRREILKYGSKIGVGSAIYGFLGNLLGKGYRIGRDFYRNEIYPIKEGVENTGEKIENWWDKYIFRKSEGQLKKEKEAKLKEEQEEISRRGFLRRLLLFSHEHPEVVGTTAGVAYGGVKFSLGGLSKYLTKKEIAKLKDQTVAYQEKIEILDKYRGYLENRLKQLTQKSEVNDKLVGDLKFNIEKLEKILKENPPSHLENKILWSSFLVVGILGLVASAFLASLSFTGFSIFSRTNSSIRIYPVVIFLVSLFSFLFARRFRGRRNSYH